MREGVARAPRASPSDPGPGGLRGRSVLGLADLISHLVVDGGSKLCPNEPVGHHGQHTEDGGEKDGQPDIGLVQGIPCSANEGEGSCEDEIHPIAVHGESNGEVDGQAAPHK